MEGVAWGSNDPYPSITRAAAACRCVVWRVVVWVWEWDARLVIFLRAPQTAHRSPKESCTRE